MWNQAACREQSQRLAAGALRFEVYGLTIELFVQPPHWLKPMLPSLPPAWIPSLGTLIDHRIGASVWQRGRRLRIEMDADGVRLLESDSWLEALRCLESHLQLYVAEHAKERIFVHAGVVGHQGQALVLPGRSFTGKTTLVAALLRAGAEYLSDEYAVFDADGLVHPYPRRLCIRDGLGSVRRARAEYLQSRTSFLPLPVGLVALTRYIGQRIWRCVPMSLGAAALAVVDNTVPIRTRPDQCLQVIQRALARASCQRITRGEAADAAERLLALLAASHDALPVSQTA